MNKGTLYYTQMKGLSPENPFLMVLIPKNVMVSCYEVITGT